MIPIATFRVPTTIALDSEQLKEARRAINTFYLGDAECNCLNQETMQYEAKYPEKETKEFKDAISRVHCDHHIHITVGLDHRGNICVL